MAMGGSVVSASPSDSLGYLRTSGTSLSTPLVAGSVAILLQMHPYWTPDSVIQALRSNSSNAEFPDNDYGWGIIDAYASALNGATGILENVALDFEVQGRTVTISVALRGGGGEHLNIQRARHPGGQGSWSPYEVQRENVFVDSTSPYTLSQTLAGGLYRYRAQRASDTTVVSQHVEVRIPYGFCLYQSYPNPFVQSASAEATIRYTLEGLPSQHGASAPIWAYMDVSLVIYDVRGARVRTLFDGIKPPGEYAARWNGRDDRGIRVSSGVYYYRLSVGGTSISKKIILLR
jgi:hypothetical protein